MWCYIYIYIYFFSFSFHFISFFFLKAQYHFRQNHTISFQKRHLWAISDFWVDFGLLGWVSMVKTNVIRPKGGGQPSYHKFFTCFVDWFCVCVCFFFHGFCGFCMWALFIWGGHQPLPFSFDFVNDLWLLRDDLNFYNHLWLLRVFFFLLNFSHWLWCLHYLGNGWFNICLLFL